MGLVQIPTINTIIKGCSGVFFIDADGSDVSPGIVDNSIVQRDVFRYRRPEQMYLNFSTGISLCFNDFSCSVAAKTFNICKVCLECLLGL